MLLSECFHFKYSFGIDNAHNKLSNRNNNKYSNGNNTIKIEFSKGSQGDSFNDFDLSLDVYLADLTSPLSCKVDDDTVFINEEIIPVHASLKNRSSWKRENQVEENKTHEKGLNFKDNPVTLSSVLFFKSQLAFKNVPKIAKFQIFVNNENGYIIILRDKFHKDSIVLDLILAILDEYNDNLKLHPCLNHDPRDYDLYLNDFEEPGQPDFDFPPLCWNHLLKNLRYNESEFQFVLCEKATMSSQSVGSKIKRILLNSNSPTEIIVSITESRQIIVPLQINNIIYFRDLMNYLYCKGFLHNFNYEYVFQVCERDRAILQLQNSIIEMNEEGKLVIVYST